MARTPYLAALPAKFQPEVVGAVAGMWLPVEVAFAHYEACSSLKLSREARLAMGRAVEEKIARTLLGTTVRMAREVGVLAASPSFPTSSAFGTGPSRGAGSRRRRWGRRR